MMAVASVIAGVYMYVNFEKLSSIGTKLAKVGFNKSGDTWSIILTVNVTNGSDIDVNINSYNLNLTVDGKVVGLFSNKTSQYVAAQTISPLIVTLSFKPADVWNNIGGIDGLLSLAAKINSLVIDVKGTVSVSHSFLSFASLPIEENFTLASMLNPTPATT